MIDSLPATPTGVPTPTAAGERSWPHRLSKLFSSCSSGGSSSDGTMDAGMQPGSPLGPPRLFLDELGEPDCVLEVGVRWVGQAVCFWRSVAGRGGGEPALAWTWSMKAPGRRQRSVGALCPTNRCLGCALAAGRWLVHTCAPQRAAPALRPLPGAVHRRWVCPAPPCLAYDTAVPSLRCGSQVVYPYSSLLLSVVWRQTQTCP